MNLAENDTGEPQRGVTINRDVRTCSLVHGARFGDGRVLADRGFGNVDGQFSHAYSWL